MKGPFKRCIAIATTRLPSKSTTPSPAQPRMPRSKRKAKPQDFVRKKAKLGKKARPANYTDTSVKKRQIHVPNQARDTSTTTGLPLRDLLSRTNHHNTNTRIASLNALTNALSDPNATAYTALSNPAPVLTTALHHLSDEPSVRLAALHLLRRVIELVDVLPFRDTITSLLLAALTHINPDIKIDTAKALTTLPVSILSKSPLHALSDLLTTPRPRGKAAALAAIASITAKTPPPTPKPTARFFYHRQIHLPPVVDFLSELSEADRGKLITRVAEALLEHLHESPRTIATSCRALAAVVVHGIPEQSKSAVRSVLKNWRFTSDTYPLSSVALSAADEKQAVAYVINMLDRGRYNDSLDTIIRDCIHVTNVASAFGDRFSDAVEQRDATFVKKSFKTAVMAMEHDDSLVKAIPQAVALLKEVDTEIACALVKAACVSWKTGSKDYHLAEHLFTVCTSPLVTNVVDEVVGVAMCAGALTGEACVHVLGECVKQGRMDAVDKFMSALEWIASRRGEERLKALALGRALGRVANGHFAGSISRIEAAVV